MTTYDSQGEAAGRMSDFKTPRELADEIADLYECDCDDEGLSNQKAHPDEVTEGSRRIAAWGVSLIEEVFRKNRLDGCGLRYELEVMQSELRRWE
jgi:hypothetical protein